MIPLGLYIHFPWCLRKCPYCDFNSHPVEGALPQEAYRGALLADLATNAPRGRSFSSIFFGGGTPSLMEAAGVGALIDATAAHGLSSDAEITLEANPGTVDEMGFSGFSAAGVNRLSLGIQSFDDRVLAALGRIHDGNAARRAAESARRRFSNLNIDLIHGCPGQDAASVRRDLRQAIALAPDHISTYQLTLEPGTAFGSRPPILPGEAVLAEIEEIVEEELAKAGYEHYETSAHALPGRRARHNLNYWLFGDYLGLGAGAHSKLTESGVVRRGARPRKPERYLREAGEPLGLEAVPSGELSLEFAMNALRLAEGFSLELFQSRTGLDPEVLAPALERAKARGLLLRDGRRVAPSPQGRRYLNELLICF